jgi:hypothetical protein
VTRFAAGRSSPLLACAGSESFDEHPAAQIELTPGQYRSIITPSTCWSCGQRDSSG